MDKSQSTPSIYNAPVGLQKAVVGGIGLAIILDCGWTITRLVKDAGLFPMTGFYLWSVISSIALPVVLIAIAFLFHPKANRLGKLFASFTLGTAAWWMVGALSETARQTYGYFGPEKDYFFVLKFQVATSAIGALLFALILTYLRRTKRWQ